jgi:hypothetical protein
VAAACTFVALFFVQNVFEQPVILKTTVPAEQRQEVNAENGNSPTATLPAEINQALGVKEMWSPIFHQPWDSSVYSPISRRLFFPKLNL